MIKHLCTSSSYLFERDCRWQLYTCGYILDGFVTLTNNCKQYAQWRIQDFVKGPSTKGARFKMLEGRGSGVWRGVSPPTGEWCGQGAVLLPRFFLFLVQNGNFLFKIFLCPVPLNTPLNRPNTLFIKHDHNILQSYISQIFGRSRHLKELGIYWLKDCWWMWRVEVTVWRSRTHISTMTPLMTSLNENLTALSSSSSTAQVRHCLCLFYCIISYAPSWIFKWRYLIGCLFTTSYYSNSSERRRDESNSL